LRPSNQNLATPLQKVLTLHAGGIGDLLLALPALRVFRRAFSRSTLELMGRPERLSLTAFDLQAQSIHSIDQAGMAYFYANGGTLPARLSAFFSSFSSVLVFGKESGSILAKNLSRAGVDRVITIPSFPPKESGTHVSDYSIESLRAAGIEGQSFSSPLRLPEEALAFAGRFRASFGLKEKEPILAIHPGSGSPAKNWDPKKFARVADWASERCKVLLISGPAQDGVEEVRGSMKKASTLVADNLPLIHLAAVLKASTAYLGNDSGITHLAASLGLPTVALFGPTDPAIWGPKGPGVHIIYEKNLCTPCPPEARSECSRPCLKSIEPDPVIDALSPFLAPTS
jgi:ADP-heptose:LPS heptosyltransferase